MGLFSNDIVTSELHVPLKVRLGYDVSNMIKTNHKLLISALKTHGVHSVMNAIEQYVNTIRRREEYYQCIEAHGRDVWFSTDWKYVTFIKGDLYVVIHVRPQPLGPAWTWEDKGFRGDVIIVLDKYLREKTFKIV